MWTDIQKIDKLLDSGWIYDYSTGFFVRGAERIGGIEFIENNFPKKTLGYSEIKITGTDNGDAKKIFAEHWLRNRPVQNKEAAAAAVEK